MGALLGGDVGDEEAATAQALGSAAARKAPAVSTVERAVRTYSMKGAESPARRREALEKCLSVMSDLNTGHGAEFVFMKIISPDDHRVAIIDDVVCTHPLSASSLDLEVPRHTHVNDDAELMQKYRCTYFVPQILGGIESDA